MTIPARDGWDWPYILYIGRVWLGYTDAEVMSMTPRKFVGQLRVHEYVSKISSEASASKEAAQPGFLDQIAGW